MPPFDDTRKRAPDGPPVGVKTIVPSSAQVPPRFAGASQSATGAPPIVATFLSLPSEKKPIQRPSGEKNGEWSAPSVPARGAAVSWSRCRR